MTTAHRPTWAPAKGGEEQGGSRFFAPSRMFSAKDQPGHTALKTRQTGQASKDELSSKDLRSALEEKERKHFKERDGEEDFEEQKNRDLMLLEAAQGRQQKPLVPKAVDADDEDDDDDAESEDSEEDSEDEEAELLAELERIKQERAEEEARKAKEAQAAKSKEMEQELQRGNPLINQAGFQVKRRWDDDVVFRNQARGEPKATKRFINDTIRSDFHRRFLDRYIK